MAKRLTFKEFELAIDQQTMPLDSLDSYVQFGRESPIPKLVFRPDALLDDPDPNYDVDRAVYRLLRKIKSDARSRTSTFTISGGRTVLAEGDSWFNLPSFPFIPPAIADWIEENGRFDMNNIADWGHTLTQMLRDRDHMKAIRQERPEFLMFSGGGNDLQEGLADKGFLYDFDPKRALDNYLTDEGKAGVAKVGEGYTEILKEVSREFPELNVLCHGYDYPRPLLDGGKYIGRYLRQQGIPDHLMDDILMPIIDLLNLTIEQAVKPFPSVQFLDLRGATEGYTWFDDMHPGREGFLALSLKFEEAMSQT